MTTTDDPLARARRLVDELLEAARRGAIVPARLPGQLEAIAAALSEASAAPAAPLPEQADYLREQAVFISTAVHELRIPMTSIRGYADMLNTPSMGELNPMQRQFLDVIRANARRMEGLLTDVSDLSKLRGGTLRVNPKMDTFKNIAMRVENAMQPLAAELGRTLTFDIPQGLPLLNLDGDLLAKALNKLVENALRYTRDDGQVTLSASGAGDQLQVRVVDNGIGMTPDELAQLGTPYFRSENEYVRTYKGSGLGIPIAYGIIALLGGSLQVESQPGQGTAFTIVLPGMS
ncbi:MAG: sensor histidine kinase [Aggregatilineales bacterium]